MRKYLIGLFMVIVIVVVIVTLQQPQHITLHKASSEITNAQFPYLTDSGDVNFFTGTSFATFNPTTGKTTTISPQFALPTVTTMRWSKTGVLFEASGYTKNDDLFQALANKHQAITQDYWWLYSFSNQRLSLVLPQNIQNRIVDAYWSSSDGNYAYISSDNTLHISSTPARVIYKTAVGGRIKQFSDGLIAIAENNYLKQINITDGSQKTLVNANFQDSYISPDGRTVGYVINTHPKATGVTPGDLYRLNPVDGKAHKLLSNFGGVMSGSNGDLYIAYQDTSGINHFELHPEAGKDVMYGLGSILGGNTAVSQILPQDPKDLFLASGPNLIKVTAESQQFSSNINTVSNIRGDYYLDGFEIHYQPTYNTYEIDIAKNPYPTYQRRALDYIRAHHVDPNQITIVWRAYDGVNNTNPHVDTTPIIFQ